MEVKPVQEAQPIATERHSRTFWDVLINVTTFLTVTFLVKPFKFLHVQVKKVQDDNKKISNFRKWYSKANQRHRRGLKINNEF